MPTPQASALIQPTAPFPLCAAQCVLLAEANHRAANQLSVLASYIRLSLKELQTHPSEIGDFQLAFAAVEAKARSLASLSGLLTAATAPSGPLDVSIVLHQVCATFSSSIEGDRRRVVDAITGTHFVTREVSIAVGQIVTEAVMNALKYAYPHDQPGEITVRSAPTEAGGLLIEVVDQGVGGPTALHAAHEKGFGVRLMRGLARQENLGLSFVATSPGVSVQLVAPAAGALSDSKPQAADLQVQ